MGKTEKRKTNSGEMSFLDHLETLRWHVIRSLIAVVIAGIVAFIFKDFIFNVILFGPKTPDFITYEWLCSGAKLIGFEGAFCFEEFPFRIISRKLSGQLSAHIWTSITAGFIMAFPYVLYQLWKFVAPALKPKEKKTSRGFILIASLLFFVGVLFGYYIISPLSINFLGSYFVSQQVNNYFDLSSYISLVRAAVISSGIIFELPIIIYILTKLGLVTPKTLKSSRKYAFVGILTVAAIITPPDIASQVIVCIPIIILYEISIKISGFVIKREKRKNKSLQKTK